MVRYFRANLESPIDFLKQYFKRNLSECCFSANKRRFGNIIKQQRDDRQQSALFSNTLLQHLYSQNQPKIVLPQCRRLPIVLLIGQVSAIGFLI
jgi:hypothetical protein